MLPSCGKVSAALERGRGISVLPPALCGGVLGAGKGKEGGGTTLLLLYLLVAVG